MGEVSLQTEETLKKLSRPLSNLGGLVPTELFALRNEVDACNKRHLAELRGQSHFFKARRGGTDDNRLYERLDKECNATELLELKVGAQVMMIKNNIDMNLVNGSMGIVVGFEEDSLPVVDFRVSPNSDATVRRTVSYEQWKLDVGNISVTKDQIPLVLAYALLVASFLLPINASFKIPKNALIFLFLISIGAFTRAKAKHCLSCVSIWARCLKRDKVMLRYHG
ncbi:hypothetical protein BDR26DRAFT_825651, partial [Obelidium mucronatum]